MVDTLIRVTGNLLGCCLGMESVQDSVHLVLHQGIK